MTSQEIDAMCIQTIDKYEYIFSLPKINSIEVYNTFQFYIYAVPIKTPSASSFTMYPCIYIKPTHSHIYLSLKNYYNSSVAFSISSSFQAT